MGVGTSLLAAGTIALTAALIYVAAKAEKMVEMMPSPEPEVEEEVISVEYRSGKVYWAALGTWKQVSTRWPNQLPADTDVTFAWEIKNTGNTGAYFQVYLFDPGEWLYVSPGDTIRVFEEIHTQVVPVEPGYQYGNIVVLGRKIDGERIGAVWVSDDLEITYV